MRRKAPATLGVRKIRCPHFHLFTWKRISPQNTHPMPEYPALRSCRFRRCYVPQKANGILFVCHAPSMQRSLRTFSTSFCPFPSVLHLQELLVELHINLAEAFADLLKSPAQEHQEMSFRFCSFQVPDFLVRFRLVLGRVSQTRLLSSEKVCYVEELSHKRDFRASSNLTATPSVLFCRPQNGGHLMQNNIVEECESQLKWLVQENQRTTDHAIKFHTSTCFPKKVNSQFINVIRTENCFF